METETQKYRRWLDGKEKAKKMWFEKYREMRRQRDHALWLLRQPNTGLHLTYLAWASWGFLFGMFVTVLAMLAMGR